MKVAIKLIEKAGGKVIGISTIGFDNTKKTKGLLDYNLNSIVSFDKI